MNRAPAAGVPRRIVVDVGLVLGAVGLVLAGLTLLTLARDEGLDAGTGRHGTASVVECRRVGPVSGSGLGFWWTCLVDVRWDTGPPARYLQPGSLFAPTDRDRQIAVREIARGGRGNLRPAGRLARPDRPVRVGLLAGGVLTLLAGGLCGLRPVFDLARAGGWLLSRRAR